MEKVKVAIIGPGNIGLDLLQKIRRSSVLELHYMVGVKASKGLEVAESYGVKTTSNGIEDLLKDDEVKICFDCTSATAHLVHAPLLKRKGIFTLDLTPAAVGPYLVPAVNLDDKLFELDNVNMVTCAGQATTPIVYAINQVADVEYAEVISAISSKSAGPGTRENIDEFTVTTRTALEKIGGADKAKVIIILNPAEPPLFMRNTIHVKVRHLDLDKITQSINDMVKKIKTYVPGYQVLLAPVINGEYVTCMIQVEGLGDYLPVYSGNLDIITSAAVATAEAYARKKLGV